MNDIYRAIAPLLLSTALLCCFPNHANAADPNDQKVHLKLGGEFIEHLILTNEGQKEVTFKEPNQTIEVVPGRYKVKSVRLTGGYLFEYYPFPGYALIEVDAKKTNVLKVGGPLKQSIDVQRRGRILVLNYHLQGIAGEEYRGTSSTPERTPGFTAYKGDKKVASCKFEYG